MYTKPTVIRRAAAVTGLCLTGLMLTACQAGSTTQATAGTSVGSASSPATGSATSAPTGSANGSNVSGASQSSSSCTTGDLTASTSYNSADNSGSTLIAFLILTNKSAKTCTVDGYAGMDLLDPSGKSLGMSTHRIAASNASPGGVQTLAPGKSASEQFTFAFADNDQGNGCENGATIAVIPPNQTQALDTKLTGVKSGTIPFFGVCGATITVFPIGPADQIPG